MEQDEIPECRICRCEGDEERPLFYPCACTGSIKWCHESCLVEWIKVSRSREYCETCGTQLMFKPVYSEATPAVLSPGELLWLGLKRIAKEVPYAVRATIVTLLWIGFVPLFSATAFNYLRPPDEYNNDEPSSTWIEWLLTRPNPISLFMWETGIWILLAGFFCLFTLVSVFDFVRGFEMGEYATELEAFQQRARARREGDVVEQHLPNQGNLGNEALRPLADIAENNDADEFEGGEEDDVDADIPVAEPFEEDDQPDLANNDNQNNEGEAARNDNLDDLGGDQLGFDEWIGLRGPWCLTVNNVLCLCFCVLLFLVAFYVIPESIGRGVLREASRVTIPMVKSGLDSLNNTMGVPSEVLVFAKQLIPDNTSGPLKTRQMERRPQDDVCEWHEPWGSVEALPQNMCDVDLIEKSLKQIEMYQFETMSVIIGLIMSMGFVQFHFTAFRWGWHMFAKARFRPSYPLRGCPYHVWRSILRITRTIVRVQKVVCLLVFKMIGFPIVLGALINSALKPALGIPEHDRTLFMAEHPHLTVLMLWVAGITHTLLVTMNVILVRDILHAEVLDGIIRMRDPHGNQFLPLLVEPIVQQTKRTFVTCGIYTVIVVLFVSLPCYAAQQLRLLPLPVSMKFASVGLQLPIESTLFHMWMLHILEKSKPAMVMAQTWFFQNTCRVLGLTEYLLPIPNDEQEYNAAVRRAQVQAGQLHWLDSTPRVSTSLLRPRIKPNWAWLRLIAFGLTAWVFWFASVVICVSLPYFFGIAAISCFPALPSWVKTDVRLYFVGFILLRYVYMYFPRVELYYLRIAMYATRNFRDLAALSCAALCLGVIGPSIAGAFVFLETAFSDSDFPAERYLEASYPTSIPIFVAFLQDFVAKLPFVRVWFAGFPIVLLISSKTAIGRAFWRAVLHLRPISAGQQASKLLFIGLGSMLLGIFLGLEFWHRAGITSSPLSTVRTSVLSAVAAACLPAYLSKYYGVVRAACRRFHDTLKDEKYLMGRRLRNYDARVV